MKKFIKQIPNILTTSRLVMAGIFVYAFLNANPTLSLSMFASASITDFLDGFLARKLDATSKYGKVIDPTADKLLMGSALILYGSKNNALMFIPLIMEGIIAAERTYFIAKSKDFKIDKAKVNQMGRIKTATLMTTISLALLKNLNLESLKFITANVINTLILGTTILQTSTVKEYIKQDLKNIKNSNKNDIRNKIEYLKKERESLINKNENNQKKELTKTKDK